MKRLILGCVLAISACTDLQMQMTGTAPAKQVTVLGRVWTVSQVADKPGFYKAVRDNNNLNPYGPPAMLRSLQAIRALQAATGCTVVRSTLYQNMSGEFFSQVSCAAGS